MYMVNIVLARQGSALSPRGAELIGPTRQQISNRARTWLDAQAVTYSVIQNEIKNGEWLLTLEMEENLGILRDLWKKIAEQHSFRGSMIVRDSDDVLVAEASMTAQGLKGKIYPRSQPTGFEDTR